MVLADFVDAAGHQVMVYLQHPLVQDPDASMQDDMSACTVARRLVNSPAAEGKPSLRACVGAMSGSRQGSNRRGGTPHALRRDILAVLNKSHYRQASRRVAADMSAAPGFAGLADVVDRLAANPTRSTPENTATPR